MSFSNAVFRSMSAVFRPLAALTWVGALLAVLGVLGIFAAALCGGAQ